MGLVVLRIELTSQPQRGWKVKVVPWKESIQQKETSKQTDRRENPKHPASSSKHPMNRAELNQARRFLANKGYNLSGKSHSYVQNLFSLYFPIQASRREAVGTVGAD